MGSAKDFEYKRYDNPKASWASNTKETFEHLHFECQVTKTLWGRMCNWMGIQRSIHDWRTEIAWISEIAKEKARGAEIKTSVFVIIVYIIWRERNKIRF
ncbi:hypothetical protein KY284_008093 [Solanum tuberosum]|nr:hypothetical protein KY284_008093 [Solanum tuberosum]